LVVREGENMKYVVTTLANERVEFVEQGDKLVVTVYRGELSNKVAVFKMNKTDLKKIAKAVS
jgi:hypothetical protein